MTDPVFFSGLSLWQSQKAAGKTMNRGICIPLFPLAIGA
jgi:hypothetical protein